MDTYTQNLEGRLDTVYNLQGEYAFVRFIGDQRPPTTANVYSAVRVNSAEYEYKGIENNLLRYDKKHKMF